MVLSESVHHRWPLSQAVVLRRQVTRRALEVFRGWSYYDIEVPLLDFVDLDPEVMALHDTNESFRVADREGNLLVMRSDVTPAIARIYARQLHTLPLPLRVCYANRVVRASSLTSLERSESYQLGLELIGDSGVLGDIEVLLICLETLEALGVRDFQVNIGHVAVFKRLLELTSLPSGPRRQITEAVAARDPYQVREVMLRFGTRDNIADALKALTLLRGGADQMAEIRRLQPHDQLLQTCLDDVSTVIELLDSLGYKDRVQVDLGEVQGPKYYSGFTFQVVGERIGRELGGGGRYDGLIGLFGKGTPAVGFSLALEALLENLHPESDALPVLSAPSGSAVRVHQDNPAEGFAQLMQRRKEGKRAVAVPVPVRRKPSSRRGGQG